MRKMSLLLLCAVLSIAVVVPGQAAHAAACNGTVTEVGGFYVDDRGEGDVWVYMESNGTVGLQSGGESPTGLYDDHCADEGPPDTLIV